MGFPILTLAVFTWLVIRHSPKLFAPRDFDNTDGYIKAIRSLTVAESKRRDLSEPEFDNRRRRSECNPPEQTSPEGWRSHVLWVDDRPDNNVYERRVFEAAGIQFTLAETTNEALRILATQPFAAIISDMGRREGPREGYVLLDAVRERGYQTPLFFYAGSKAREHKIETAKHGGQGCTNNTQELFRMVTAAVKVVDKNVHAVER